MSELFDKSIRTLELPRVLKLLADQAVSPEAKELALAVRPETDYEDVLRLLDQTDGARTMMVLHGAPGFSGVKPIRELLDRADRGGSLSISELIRVGDLLYAARRAKEYFNMDAMEPTAIDQIFLSIHGNRFLEDKIRRCIADENTVADAASPDSSSGRTGCAAASSSSASVRTAHRLTRGPKSGLRKRRLQPISPRPAATAALASCRLRTSAAVRNTSGVR